MRLFPTLYALGAELSDEERQRHRGAFFRSVNGTLNHLLLGDRAWMQRSAGQSVTMRSPDRHGSRSHLQFR